MRVVQSTFEVPFRPRTLYPLLNLSTNWLSRTRLHNDPGHCTFSSSGSEFIAHSNPQVLYEPLGGVERQENYRVGGYHTLRIDDFLPYRYRILHKLGHGTYSTAWLARDAQLERYVAVKVCTSNANPREPEVLSALTESRCSSAGSLQESIIPTVLDDFTIDGPNGFHACYVSVLARASFAGVKEEPWRCLFQLDVARVLAAQLVAAIECIHAQGYVHGDLHLGNVLLKMPPGFDQLSSKQLYGTYGAPELDPVVHLDGEPLPPNVPSHGIASILLGEASKELTPAEASILLSDFGEAFAPSQEQKYESHAALVIRPPEARVEFANSPSFPSDIWTLACSIWDIIAPRPLFEGFLATQDDMTCENVDALGILPPMWWERWEARALKFTEDGTPINHSYYWSWEERFEDSVQQPRRKREMPTFEIDEKTAISAMLRSMLAYRPEDRLTAKQVLESKWMVKWALPELKRVKTAIEG